MSTSTAILLELEPPTPPAVFTASGRFSPRRRVPNCSASREMVLRSLEPPSLACAVSPSASLVPYHRTSTQKVRFDLASTKTYECPSCLCHNDHDDDTTCTWYTSHQIAAMRQEHTDCALALREQAKISESEWQNAIKRVYQAASRAAEVDDLLQVLEQSTKLSTNENNNRPPTYFRGLETAAVAYIALDNTARRLRLYQRVKQCQAIVADATVRAEMLRQTCRTFSRPTRVLARHLAVLSSLQE